MLCFLHLLFYDATQDIILLHRHPISYYFYKNIFIQTLVNASVLIKASQNMYTKLLIELL